MKRRGSHRKSCTRPDVRAILPAGSFTMYLAKDMPPFVTNDRLLLSAEASPRPGDTVLIETFDNNYTFTVFEPENTVGVIGVVVQIYRQHDRTRQQVKP